ncbi:phage holin family protein [Streptomyces sp. NPDC051940]|uniref:phage holin family protein n=1 Tax=Streptomyces sp. NPDC051940 TaxID=3155675 RepID=UPI003444B53B
MTEHSVGELVRQASEQASDLVREELRLAQAEMAEKGRRFARGGGYAGAAAVLAFTGLLALAATGVAALDLRLPLWLSTAVVAAALFVLAGLFAAAGKRQAGRATPLLPQEAVRGVKADVHEIKERMAHHDKHPGQAARTGVDGAQPTR